jgi:hypothetical protein
MPEDSARVGWQPVHGIAVFLSLFVAGPLGMLMTAFFCLIWSRRSPAVATEKPSPSRHTSTRFDPFWKPFPDPEDPLRSHRDLFDD